MIVAHLSDLHLGFRAREGKGLEADPRERDVADAFVRAMEALVAAGPALVVVTGDVFDRPDPPPSAVLTLIRGVEILRAGLPSCPLLLAAGARDTALAPDLPGPLELVAGLPGVYVAAGSARTISLLDGSVSVCLVPHRALAEGAPPRVEPAPDAPWNILAAYARAGGGPGALDASAEGWSYVGLGSSHRHRRVGARTWYAGSLERVGAEPWREAASEKGFFLFDLRRGRGRLHPVPGRPVVALAPIRVPDAVEGVRRRVGEVTNEVPGGIEGKIVHLTLRGVPPGALLALQGEVLSSLRKRALQVLVEVEDPEAATATSEEPAEPGGRAGLSALLARRPGALEAHLEHMLRHPGSDVAGPGPAHRPGTAVPGDTPGGRDAEAGVVVIRLLDALGNGRARLPGGAVTATGGSPSGPGIPVRTPDAAGTGDAGDPDRELRLRELAGAPEMLREAEGELRRLRADHAEVAGDLEEATMEWLRERQDAETQLQAYRDRARELKARLGHLESSGTDAPCPTCGRILGDHLTEVLRELREEWESVVQDGTWWKRRREQLEAKPEALRALEGRSVRLQAALEDHAEQVERARAWVRELDELRAGAAVPESAGSTEGIARVVARASRLVNRLTGGRIIALTPAGGREVHLEGFARRLHGPEPADLAVATLALELSSAWCEIPGGTVVVADGFDALDPDDRLRAVDVLPDLVEPPGRVVLATRSDVPERRCEAFTEILLVDPGEPPRRLPSAAGHVRPG